MQPKVKLEATGARDLRLSEEHRRWGWDCPATDIDFLLVEYSYGKAKALVEYKGEKAAVQIATHPTYRALIDLADADREAVPLFVCRYADDFSFWIVTPLNDCAKRILPSHAKLSKQGWVTFLYRMRGLALPAGLFDQNGALLEVGS